jgi:single-stranded DNA-binding protein
VENKVRFDGIILNEPKLTEYSTTLLRLQNKQEFKKKDGTIGNASCTMVVSARDKVAQEIVDRFAKGDVVRVEGRLSLKKKKDVYDSEGKEIWETWINAYKVDAIPGQTQGKVLQKPIEERMGYSKPVSPQVKTFGFKANPTPVVQLSVEPEPNPNDQYGMDDNELPF